MTNNQLEACLIEAVEKLSEHILLTGTKGERKSLKGYPGALPQLSLPEYWEMEESESLGDSAVEDTLIPYCVVKTTEVDMKEDAAKAKVYLVFCLYARGRRASDDVEPFKLCDRVFPDTPSIGCLLL